jgi:hypothetical protein
MPLHCRARLRRTLGYNDHQDTPLLIVRLLSLLLLVLLLLHAAALQGKVEKDAGVL